MLDRLPNELFHLIFRLALPSYDNLLPKAVGRRQTLLIALSRVSKRLCAVTKPFLLQTIRIGTPRQAQAVAKLSKELREQVETVVFYISTTSLDELDPYGEDYEPDLLVGSEAIDAFRTFPKVKHARFYDSGDLSTEYMTWQTSLDFDLGATSPLRDLDSLFLSNCKLNFALPNLRILRSDKMRYDYATRGTWQLPRPGIPVELMMRSETSQIMADQVPASSKSAFEHGFILVHPSWSDTATIIPDLHNLEAVFVNCDIHPDKVEPKKRVYAERLLDAVKQTPAEIIWTGSDDHAFILPEFEQYIKDRK